MTQIPEEHPENSIVAEPVTLGVLARLAGPDELVEAARQMREKGYTKLEAFSPFPVPGIDEALAAPKPILPWVVFCAGFTGMLVALGLQFYTNSVEGAWAFSGYDYHISGKPSFSLPANIPVTFELIILFSAFTSFLGMLAFNGLPRLYNPMFRSAQFLSATNDGFFLFADARDPQFDAGAISNAMATVGATGMETITDDPTPALVPGWFHAIGGTVAVLALVPIAYIAMARGDNSDAPRWQMWIDMDFQPKAKTQVLMKNDIFADGRTMRLPVDGTVARGTLYEDPRLYYGVEPDADSGEVFFLQEETGPPEPADPPQPAELDPQPAELDKTAGDATAKGDATADPPTQESTGDNNTGDNNTEENAEPEPNWVTKFPMKVDKAMMDRGQERFNIHCAACHGLAGYGDGLVAQRALTLEQATWVQPSNIHQDYIRAQPPGKLYNTITNGIRKMPAYREHISLEDRWAIVLYVKALQESQWADKSVLSDEELKQMPLTQ